MNTLLINFSATQSRRRMPRPNAPRGQFRIASTLIEHGQHIDGLVPSVDTWPLLGQAKVVRPLFLPELAIVNRSAAFPYCH